MSDPDRHSILPEPVTADQSRGAALPSATSGGDAGALAPDHPRLDINGGASLDFRGVSLAGRDLRNMDFSGLDLEGADLSGCNLTGVQFFRTRLRGANLARAELAGAELCGADLTGACLDDANGEKAGFGMAVVRNARFFQCRLRGSTFSKASLEGADFRCADLRNARLREADLRRCDFTSADLERADLSLSRVHRASFRNAHVPRCRLRSLQGFEKADWIGVDIHNINFAGAYRLRRHVIDQNYLKEFRESGPMARVFYAIWWATSDCGRSLFRWGLWIILQTLVFAWLYTRVGIDYGPHHSWLSPFYYSVVTFTTLGYGDVVPTTAAAQWLAMVEVFFGYVMLGGLLSIFSNIIARRGE